jgi:hypothetical protein
MMTLRHVSILLYVLWPNFNSFSVSSGASAMQVFDLA